MFSSTVTTPRGQPAEFANRAVVSPRNVPVSTQPLALASATAASRFAVLTSLYMGSDSGTTNSS